MGICYSKKSTPEQIAESFRIENDRITLKIQKLISRSYQAGFLKDYEYNSVLNYYFAIRNRHELYPDQAFVNALAHIHDLLVQNIQERNLKLNLKGIDPLSVRPLLATPVPPLPSAPPENQEVYFDEYGGAKPKLPNSEKSTCQDSNGGLLAVGLYPQLPPAAQ